MRRRLGDLAAWLREEFGVSVSETTVKLAEQPWRIMSLGPRDWAHGF